MRFLACVNNVILACFPVKKFHVRYGGLGLVGPIATNPGHFFDRFIDASLFLFFFHIMIGLNVMFYCVFHVL